ncbi:MAG: hypothetical protein WBK51_12100, partial [Polaromonas sp.]
QGKVDQGKRLFERSEFAIDPTLNEHRSVPVAQRRDSDCGSPFLCLLSFGEAKESELPPGNPRQTPQSNPL